VAKFRYLGNAVRNQNSIQEEIRNRLNSGNTCYNAVHNLLSSRLLSDNINMNLQAYKTTILPAVLYAYGTWSLTLQEDHILRVFKNRAPRRVFGSF
jgi:hypothetical protein